jgi:hypothetical protein
VTADEYLAALNLASPKDWKRQVATRDGKDVAVVLTKGTEIHFVSLDEKRAMTRKNTLEFLKPIHDEFGYVTTRVPIAETNHRLREILGFQYQWSDENFSYWILHDLPWSKHDHQRYQNPTSAHLH